LGTARCESSGAFFIYRIIAKKNELVQIGSILADFFEKSHELVKKLE